MNKKDEELLELISKGYTSSYKVWTYVHNNPTKYIKPVAYKNINSRFLRLSRDGILKETKMGDNNLHAAKHYIIVKKVLESYIKTKREELNKLGSILSS